MCEVLLSDWNPPVRPYFNDDDDDDVSVALRIWQLSKVRLSWWQESWEGRLFRIISRLNYNKQRNTSNQT